MATIKIVTKDEGRSRAQKNQGKTMNQKRPDNDSVADALRNERANIDNQPLELAEGTIEQMRPSPTGAPLNDMTGKSSMGFKQAAGAVGLVALGGQAINEVTSNVGLFYNDASKQNQMTNVQEGLSIGGSIIGGAIAGAVVGGPVGAAIGGAIGLAKEALSLASESVELSRRLSNDFRQAERDSARLGQIVSVRR